MHSTLKGLPLASCLLSMLMGSLLLAAGCDSAPPPPPERVVTGLVTYQGKPVTGGTVIFQPMEKGARPYMGVIGDDGNYELSYIVPGEFAVAVETETKRGLPTHVEIPRRYNSPSQSGLKFQVGEGAQTYNIELD